jgi:hypothetical protein
MATSTLFPTDPDTPPAFHLLAKPTGDICGREA